VESFLPKHEFQVALTENISCYTHAGFCGEIRDEQPVAKPHPGKWLSSHRSGG
jgi:hypothetical protein